MKQNTRCEMVIIQRSGITGRQYRRYDMKRTVLNKFYSIISCLDVLSHYFEKEGESCFFRGYVCVVVMHVLLSNIF